MLRVDELEKAQGIEAQYFDSILEVRRAGLLLRLSGRGVLFLRQGVKSQY